MTIQLHRLEGFYWVSLHSGYAAAARNFPYSITQPAVHQQVKKLEDELGCKLFERIAKDQVRHTPEGRRLFEFCAPFFEGLPAVVRSIQAGSFGGELRIDAIPLAVRHLLPEWIRALRTARSDAHVRLTEVEAPDLDKLRTGEADLSVGLFDVVPDGVECAKIGTAYPYAVFPEDHDLAARKKLRPELLGSQPFITYPDPSRARQQQLHALDRLGVTASRLVPAPSAEAILSYVAAGLGVSILPWVDKDGPKLRGVAARRLKGLGAELAIRAAYRPGAGEHPLVRAALDAAPSAKKHR